MKNYIFLCLNLALKCNAGLYEKKQLKYNEIKRIKKKKIDEYEKEEQQSRDKIQESDKFTVVAL